MIDLPIYNEQRGGKALVAVENEGTDCGECALIAFSLVNKDNCWDLFPCEKHSRKDGKNVIFKLIDIPVKTGGSL